MGCITAGALGAQAEEQSELEKIHDVLNEKKLSNCYKTGCTTKECPEGFKVRIVDLELSGPVVCVWCMEKDPSGTRRRHVSAAPGVLLDPALLEAALLLLSFGREMELMRLASMTLS